MIEMTLYGFGIFCRLIALAIAFQIMKKTASWRFGFITIGAAWIVIYPIFQLVALDEITTKGLIEPPEIFAITSMIAIIVAHQLKHLLLKNAQYEQSELDTAKQHSHRQTLLLKLARKQHQSLQEGIEHILLEAATELKLARIGVWLYNDNRTAIDSLVLFDQGEINLTPQTLLQEELPNYFLALENEGMIVASNGRTHQGTKELKDPYLIANDIYSLLDVPIRIDGNVVGILCHEHTKEIRNWSWEDQEFAHSLADLAAILIAQDRKTQIEKKLIESERRLADAQDSGQFGSYSWDLATGHVVWSGKVLHHLGYREGVAPSFAKDILPNVVDADAARFTKLLRKAYEKHEPFRLRIQTTAENGGRFFEARGYYAEADEGQDGKFEGTVQDVTEQILIERENRSLEGQLIQSQKMESMGTMAGGIAHDFNNILTPILGYADIALAEVGETSKLSGPLKEILNSSLRAKELIEQILVFSRRFDDRTEAVDLNATIESALRLMRPALPLNIRISVDIDEKTQPVSADDTQMIQVIVNLFTNAWHAMKDQGGDLTISLKPAIRHHKYFAELSVSDTGVGIPLEAQQRIFEPFYTTKDVGKGTGLGLSILHGIVSKLGGEIELESEPGIGTTFKVFVPVSEKPPAVIETLEEPTNLETASILVVDDDEAVARILNSMLTDLGYDVDVHLSGEAALECFSGAPKEYDLLVTDLNMPTMSGIELCQRVRKIEPTLPVFILSGFASSVVREEVELLERCRILNKPLIRAELAKAVREELQS